jgi:hypothetical protein
MLDCILLPVGKSTYKWLEREAIIVIKIEDDVISSLLIAKNYLVVLFSWFPAGLRLSLFGFVPFLESFHSACRIHYFLFAGHKGMAIGTNFYLDIFFGRSCFNDIAANTSYCGLFIFRMNAFFHVLSFSSLAFIYD